MEKPLHNLPYFIMTPSCGIIMCQPDTRKLYKAYTMGTEYDFYPNFICWKPKLKWNLTKFDFLRTQENDLNWCIPTVRNTPISGPYSSGISQFETLKQPLSTHKFSPSLSLHPTLWEETLNTRNNLTSYWNRLMTSSSALNIGFLWKVLKQNPNQAVPFPPFSSPYYLCLHPQIASAELIFAQCNYRPDTPPTPTYIELWKPSQELQPRRGVHYLHHSSFTESGSSI